MRKLYLSLAGVAALAMASAANATITLNTCSMTCTGPATTGSTTTIGYTDAGLANPSFTETLNFTNTLAGLYSVTLDTSSAAVNFTSAWLSDGTTTAPLSFIGQLGPLEFWGLDTTLLGAGTYTLTINGNNNDTGSLGGTVTITDHGVPEPATWAMMLFGFAGIGLAMRHKRRTLALAQAA
jgi:hypothetical protein